MKVVAFLTNYSVVDRIIRNLKLTFVVEKPPPSHVFEQVALAAGERSGDRLSCRASLDRGKTG